MGKRTAKLLGAAVFGIGLTGGAVAASAAEPAKGSALDIPAEPSAGCQCLLSRSARRGLLCGPLQQVQNSRTGPHSGPQPSVAVRMQNVANVPEWILAGARLQATRIYEAAGVELIWEDDARKRAVTVMLVAGRSASLPPGVFGRAVRGADLVYVHSDRVAALARRNRVPPGTLLGNAIAHELGHLLLPASGHSGTGIMTDSLNVLNPHIVRFAPHEATAIREGLANQPKAIMAHPE